MTKEFVKKLGGFILLSTFIVLTGELVILVVSTLLYVGWSALPAHAAPVPVVVCPHTWSFNMGQGSDSLDVYNLQRFLNEDPSTALAAVGPGSPGSETLRYGPLTTEAVSRFQEKFADFILFPLDLTQPTGYVGRATREMLNTLCGAEVITGNAGHPAGVTAGGSGTDGTFVQSVTVGTQSP